MKQKLIVILFLITNVGFAQREANIWYFGNNAGLDFNSGSPSVLLDGVLSTEEGCATISTASGDLLFYTDGITIWNKDHLIMLNGTGLNGDVTSTHSALIVPKPDDPNIYYIFTVDAEAGSNGLQYSEVDMTLDFGLGGVTANKNILLHTPTTEKLTAIQSSISNEFWVISHKWNSNEFITYKVSGLGVSITPVISAIGTIVDDAPVTTGTAKPEARTRGQIKVSPDGTKLAVARSEGLSEVQLFNFDTATGIVSNPLTVLDFPDDNQVYGVEFSPNSKVLYISVLGNGIYQYNLEAGSSAGIVASQFLITTIRRPYAGMQLATNGKIYVAKPNQLNIDVIDNPNAIGVACNFQYEHLFLGGRKSQSGLPPFIQSFLLIEDIQFENVCFGDVTSFSLKDTVDNVVWNFDDLASGSNNTSIDLTPTHTFSGPGFYEVSVNATIGGQTASSTTTVTIYEQPVATKPHDILLCDFVGDITFDLVGHNTFVLNGLDPNVFGVNYYEGMTNYTNGAKIAVPEGYINPSSFFTQEIIAEVYNKQNPECADITTFNIGIYKSPRLESSSNLSSLTQCDNFDSGSDVDGVAEFDLTMQEQYLLLNGVASEVHYNYFTDAALTQPIISPNAFINTQNPQIIYVEGVSNVNSECKTTTSFVIEIFELPPVTPTVELKQCDDDLDGFSVFNLTEVYAELSPNAQNEAITFYESLSDAENGNNPITNEVTYSNEVVSSDTVWARVENNNGCHRTAQVNLIVSTTQIPNTYTKDFYKCDNGIDTTDGIATFDLSSVDAEIQAMFPVGQQLIINYYRNQADALSEINPISSITNYQNIGYPNAQDVFIRVDSATDNDCLGLGHHITLHVEKVPVASPVTIPKQCDDDGDNMFAFDTSGIETTLLNGQTSVVVTYTDGNGNVLPTPLPNPFLTPTQTVRARVINATSQDPNSVCYDETIISFSVDAAAVAHLVNDIIECDDDDDGQFPFNTSSIESTILNGQTGMIVSYIDENGNTLPSPLPNPFITSTQTITVRVENVLSNICFDTTTIDFVVVDQPELLMDDTWLICENDIVEIIADAGYDEYLWSTGETSQTIMISDVGSYEVTVTNLHNSIRCSTTKAVTVIASGPAKITDIQTKDWTISNNEVVILTEGTGNYEYSLDGIQYQDSNEFKNLNVDDYTIFVRDKNGCGVVTEDIYLMYYPHFFTPNGDGYNDTWQIINSDKEPLNKIYIYDRYGKLLKQLNPTNIGWDGTFNGQLLSSNDYWFVLERQNGKTYKGHFALKI